MEKNGVSVPGRNPTGSQERILRALTEPRTITELSRELGLHENTVRAHLRALHQAGQVDEVAPESGQRGRPATRWVHTPLITQDPYAALAAALATQLGALSADPAASAEAAGEAWGASLATQLPEGLHPVEAMAELMRAQGFAPEPTTEGMELTRCPLIDAANQRPDIVCSVHRGMVRGALRALGSTLTHAQLIPFASAGACTLTLTDERDA